MLVLGVLWRTVVEGRQEPNAIAVRYLPVTRRHFGVNHYPVLVIVVADFILFSLGVQLFRSVFVCMLKDAVLSCLEEDSFARNMIRSICCLELYPRLPRT